MIISPPTKVVVKPSPVHGLGVFAKEFIFKGEKVELAPIAVTGRNKKNPAEWSPQDLIYFKYNSGWGAWGHESIVCTAFGYASLYNHSENPNIKFKKDISKCILTFIALKDIEAGKECFLCYEKNYKTKFIREEYDE